MLPCRHGIQYAVENQGGSGHQRKRLSDPDRAWKSGFSGDLVITMDDLADELKDKVPYALGIRNIMDKVEMKSKMEEFLATK